MKPTCIAYTNTNEYNIQTCGFHQTFKKINYILMDEIKYKINLTKQSFFKKIHCQEINKT